MKMVAPVPGQSIQTSSGNHYRADESRVIHDVNPDDVSELRRVGCVDLAEAIAQRDAEPAPAPEPGPMPQGQAAADAEVTDDEIASPAATTDEPHE